METNESYIKELLIELKKPISCTWRVQSYSKFKPEATVMAYIDARDAMDVLDAHCKYGWTREHYLIDTKVYCRVGIIMPDGSIQTRSDCGTESNQDAEKGQASDSFKRACVNFGIGRFLYDLKIQKIAANGKKEGNNFPYCVDENGKQIWDLTKHINNKSSTTKTTPTITAPDIPKITPIVHPDLLPATEKWEKVKQALLEDTATWNLVKTKLSISAENEKLMNDEVKKAKAEVAARMKVAV